MLIYDEVRKTEVKRTHVQTVCDKCGKIIEEKNDWKEFYVDYSGYPKINYPEGPIYSFQVCTDCNEDLLNSWLRTWEDVG